MKKEHPAGIAPLPDARAWRFRLFRSHNATKRACCSVRAQGERHLNDACQVATFMIWCFRDRPSPDADRLPRQQDFPDPSAQ